MHLVLRILLLPLIIIFSYLEALVKLFIPARRKNVCGEIVLITGAGHGIGRNTAYEFAKLQSKLVLWDINKQSVEATAEECQKLGAKAYAYVVDCSLKQEIYSAAEKVKKDVGDVSILVNNAGVVVAADLLSTQDKLIEKTFQVNILAHYWTTKAFLPAMMEKNHGHIVTVASIAGLMTVPFLVSYCSSKFAAVGFHQSLTQELAVLGKDGIQTTCLCPTFVNTGFIKLPNKGFVPLLKVEKVAEKLVDGILCNQKMIVIPPFMNAVLLMERLLPERAVRAVNRIPDVQYDSMIESKSAKKHLS